MNNIKNIPDPKFIPSSPKKTRTNGDSIRALTNEQLAEWIEDYVQEYMNFWVDPDYCVPNRESDQKILLEWLNEEILEEEIFYF